MPADRNVTLDINLLGRDYKVGCKESERAELSEAVAFLDGKMREIRGAGKVAGADRIAVMAALNIAHELLRARRAPPDVAAPPPAPVNGTGEDASARTRRIQAMGSAIDELLASQEKLF